MMRDNVTLSPLGPPPPERGETIAPLSRIRDGVASAGSGGAPPDGGQVLGVREPGALRANLDDAAGRKHFLPFQ
jgi:hypothetical protein